MERLRNKLTAERAIKYGIAAITAYELACPSGETISEGTDKYIEKHPLLTRFIIGYTALHLANLLPKKLDAFYQVTKLKCSNPL